jgi:putative copper export protein/mono/diheme cytochrome c family protein
MAEALAWVARWVGFVALAALIGGFAVDLLVLPARVLELDSVRGRLRALRLGSALVVLVAAAGELLLRAATMSGGGLGAAVPAVPAVLTRTHFGAAWSARAVALLALLAPAVARSRAWRSLGALLALGVAATVTLTGHAADRGDVSVTAVLDWAHVVAASTWAGGLLVLATLVRRAAPRWPPALLPAVMRRFSTLAATCLTVVVLSGAYRALIELPAVDALWRTAYGRVLAAKVLLATALIACGGVNRYLVLPRLGAGRATGPAARMFRLGRLALLGARRAPRPAASRLAAWLLREAALALAIFWCTAMLVESTPARHAGHAAHAAASGEPRRVTMAELHAAGGVPSGWLFSPPPGDAARGRAIFLRLGCVACHRIAEESRPPSAGLGPDLTEAGEHHPAGYLLESVINPDAAIVEGPGYTGADGRSIMPSYADRLTVTELVDLVAYLRALRAVSR